MDLYMYVWQVIGLIVFCQASNDQAQLDGNYSTLPPGYNEVASVWMTFRTSDNVNSPTIHNVFLGDKFYLFLQYTGVSHYSIYPINCSAFEGTYIDNSTKSKLLYDDETFSQNRNLMSNFTNLDDNTVLFAEMYAFRFKNSYVTVSCNVGVCPVTASLQGCLPKTRKRGRVYRTVARDLVFKVTDRSEMQNTANSLFGISKKQRFIHISILLLHILIFPSTDQC